MYLRKLRDNFVKSIMNKKSMGIVTNFLLLIRILFFKRKNIKLCWLYSLNRFGVEAKEEENRFGAHFL